VYFLRENEDFQEVDAGFCVDWDDGTEAQCTRYSADGDFGDVVPVKPDFGGVRTEKGAELVAD
jgi:hypothetical protein